MAIKPELVQFFLFKHLKHFNTSGGDVTLATPFELALSNRQVAGTSPRTMFKAICRHDIVGNGGTDRPWPQGWPKMNCESLAPELAK